MVRPPRSGPERERERERREEKDGEEKEREGDAYVAFFTGWKKETVQNGFITDEMAPKCQKSP